MIIVKSHQPVPEGEITVPQSHFAKKSTLNAFSSTEKYNTRTEVHASFLFLKLSDTLCRSKGVMSWCYSLSGTEESRSGPKEGKADCKDSEWVREISNNFKK